MKKRFEALDILRGLTVILMILVNNPGSWRNIYAPLRHASWDAMLTPTDMVFPFFLFCVGMSMAWSLAKFPSLTWEAFGKIAKRTALIFLTGLLLNAFPFDHWSSLRIMGVLQRIALCYFFGSLIVLLVREKFLWVVIAGLLTVYTAIIYFCSENGFALDGNISAAVDVALFGPDHVYHGYGCPFDPEGPLGTMSAVCNALLGYLVARFIRRRSEGDAGCCAASSGTAEGGCAGQGYTIAIIMVAGLLSVAFSQILSIWIPVNKPIWSASYVFCTVGWAMEVLGCVMLLEPTKFGARLFAPAKCFGHNTITAYVLASLLAKTMNLVLPQIHDLCTTKFYSLIHAICYILVVYAIIWIMERKKIYLKF